MSSNLSLTVVPNHLSQNTEQTCTSNTAHLTQAARDHSPGTHPDVQCGMNETLVYRLSTCARELLFCDATVPSWFTAPSANRNRGMYSAAAAGGPGHDVACRLLDTGVRRRRQDDTPGKTTVHLSQAKHAGCAVALCVVH
jgi:hypothetical protein